MPLEDAKTILAMLNETYAGLHKLAEQTEQDWKASILIAELEGKVLGTIMTVNSYIDSQTGVTNGN